MELLGVPAELIGAHGAVSPEVAEAMADGAIERFDADVGVGITGIAGPDGGTRVKAGRLRLHLRQGAGGASMARDPVLPGDRARDP